jgi:hypothetical protein
MACRKFHQEQAVRQQVTRRLQGRLHCTRDSLMGGLGCSYARFYWLFVRVQRGADTPAADAN